MCQRDKQNRRLAGHYPKQATVLSQNGKYPLFSSEKIKSLLHKIPLPMIMSEQASYHLSQLLIDCIINPHNCNSFLQIITYYTKSVLKNRYSALCLVSNFSINPAFFGVCMV
jgi:hypothetical protein